MSGGMFPAGIATREQSDFHVCKTATGILSVAVSILASVFYIAEFSSVIFIVIVSFSFIFSSAVLSVVSPILLLY